MVEPRPLGDLFPRDVPALPGPPLGAPVPYDVVVAAVDVAGVAGSWRAVLLLWWLERADGGGDYAGNPCGRGEPSVPGELLDLGGCTGRQVDGEAVGLWADWHGLRIPRGAALGRQTGQQPPPHRGRWFWVTLSCFYIIFPLFMGALRLHYTAVCSSQHPRAMPRAMCRTTTAQHATHTH